MDGRVRELSVIAGVFANLMNRRLALDSTEESLVVEALRRSSSDLRDASLSDLSNYLQSLDDSQLKGAANNVKGIYHELIYAARYNAGHPDAIAELHSDTNFPGSDVVIRDSDTGDVLREIQLKASDSLAYLAEHEIRYPEIDLLATSEIASQCDGVETSGFSNAELSADVDLQIDQLFDLSVGGQVLHGTETSALVSGGLRAIEILQGKSTPTEALKKSAADIAISAGTSAFVAFLFS